MNIEIIKVNKKEDLVLCSNLRKQVFGDEENASRTLYLIDENDKKDDTIVYLLKVENIPIATVRLIKVNDFVCKLQRFVVLKEYRKKGYATMLLYNFEVDACDLGYKKIILDSSTSAVGFYKKNNYEIVSDVYFQEGRSRVKMEKELSGL